MVKTNQDIERSLNLFKQESFKILGPFAFFIYLAMSFADSSLSEKGLWFFIGIRALFVMPTLVLSLLIERIDLKYAEPAIFFGFLSPGLGIAFISYLLGGLTSDYYFGVLIVSFVQYAFTPLSRGMTFLLDIILFAAFFSLNILPFDIPIDEITKQISNYLSFVTLKLVMVRKSHNLISDALKTSQLEKELDTQRYLQKLMGELCHLFNNPLFISMNMLKKLRKGEHLLKEDTEKLDKIYESNQRMDKVLKKMLSLTSKENGKVEFKDIID